VGFNPRIMRSINLKTIQPFPVALTGSIIKVLCISTFTT